MKKVLTITLIMLLAWGGGAFAQCSAPAPITGSNVLCPPSYTTTLSDATAGGTWSTGDGGCITINPSTGVVTGTCGGVETVTYTVPGGCYVTFNIGSAAIIGPAAVCSLSTATMSDVFGGGTWGTTSSDITITSGGGIVSVLSGLTATTSALITYVPPLSTGCSTVTANIVVDKTPIILDLASDPVGSTICENAPISFTTTVDPTSPGVAPYTYNWWWVGSPSGTFATNSGVVSTISTGYQMGGIALTQAGTYYGNVADHWGCVSPTYTGPNISVIAAPIAYTVSYYTSSHAPGCDLQLSGSQSGVSYNYGIYGIGTLGYNMGTGSSFYWTTDPIEEGNYWVVGWDLSTHCGTLMSPTIPVCTGCRMASPYLGVGATTTEEPLALLPNPNNGNFTLSGSADFMTSTKTIKAEIIDMTGHMVLSQDIPVTNGSISKSIQLPGDIANGTYFVKLSTGTQSEVLRMSLNK